jgi:hypothetical protein
MKFNFLAGVVKVIIASLPFPAVTLATCAVAVQLLHPTPYRSWAEEYGRYLYFAAPCFVFVSAVIAFNEVGSSGAFGADAAHDMRDAFRRLFFRHVFFSACFLAPLAVVYYRSGVPAYVCLLSLYFVNLSINPCAYVDDAIVQRTRQENLGRFLGAVGSSRRAKHTKGIRRK